jgi:hypothetical protein
MNQVRKLVMASRYELQNIPFVHVAEIMITIDHHIDVAHTIQPLKRLPTIKTPHTQVHVKRECTPSVLPDIACPKR